MTYGLIKMTAEDGENGYYDIRIITHNYEDAIKFQAAAKNPDNLAWQMRQLLAYVKTLPGIESFDANIFVQIAPAVYWKAADKDKN